MARTPSKILSQSEIKAAGKVAATALKEAKAGHAAALSAVAKADKAHDALKAKALKEHDAAGIAIGKAHAKLDKAHGIVVKGLNKDVAVAHKAVVAAEKAMPAAPTAD